LLKKWIFNKTLVLGLGNDLLSDDALGIRVVRELQRRLSGRQDLVFQEASVAGLALLDLVCGYKSLIVVDAIKTQGGEPGEIYRLSEDSLPGNSTKLSVHSLGLRTVLELGRSCGVSVPEKVVIYAVEVEDLHTWRRGLTHRVQRAIPLVTQKILNEELSAEARPSVN
jgi:hydrogenase maturation protease